jgi:hypothetical protein
VLGSTGSIGTQTLDIMAEFPEKFKLVALSAGSNVELLAKQVRRRRAAGGGPAAAAALRSCHRSEAGVQQRRSGPGPLARIAAAAPPAAGCRPRHPARGWRRPAGRAASQHGPPARAAPRRCASSSPRWWP